MTASGNHISSPALRLTPEQEAILASTGHIKINAVAGSGKTTTVIRYAATRPAGSRILYLAFNRSVRLEAQSRFAAAGLRHVRVETAHSLAHKAVVPQRGYAVRPQGLTTFETAELLGLKDHGEKHGAYILASHVNKYLAYFCNSDAEKVQQLAYIDTVGDAKARAFVRTFHPYILEGTRHLLKKMNDGATPVTHDFYLKLYQLSAPQLPYDYVLFDEGQDASPAMLDVFLKQSATRVIVGDAHQQIYGWRHAVNSLEKADFANYNLSVSFRFGQSIASLGTSILGWKAHLQGTRPVVITGNGTSADTRQKATLARTNLGLLLRAISFLKENRNVQRLYFEGNLHSYTYADDGASLYDVLNLYNGQHNRIRNKLIASMSTVEDLEEYIEKTEDLQLAMMVEIVAEYGNEIPALIKQLKEKHVGDDRRHEAEMIFSTVHRAKGMEYDVVHLVDDFITESKLEKLAEDGETLQAMRAKLTEEINLLYVAVTRAKTLLHLPEALLPKGFVPGSEIRVIKKSPLEDRTKTAAKSSPVSYRQTRLAAKNAGEFWTDERDDDLRRLFHNGVALAGIAARFGCKPAAVVARLKKIGCVE